MSNESYQTGYDVSLGTLLSDNMPNPTLLTSNELKLWLNYIEHEVGFILPISQNNWVQTTIERYLQQCQMTTTELLSSLSYDKALYHQLFDDILIPRTQFFRHLPSFRFIESYARQFRLESQSKPVHTPLIAWSVGCSSGQEAVSVCLSLAKALGVLADFQVFGSDFHQKSLAFAKMGQYEANQLLDIPSRYHAYIDQQGITNNVATPSPQKRVFSLKSNLAKHVTYFSHNLMNSSESLPMALGSCQLILCKNVLIYFRQFDQRDIINRLVDYLTEDGVLILGVGELPNFSNPRLKRLPYPHINGFCKINSPVWLKQLYLAD